MRSSIRWTLLGWFGLLLAGVLCVFGVLLVERVAAESLTGVDAGLESRARAIVGGLEHDPVDGWELELTDDYLSGLAGEVRFAVWGPDGELMRSGGAGAPTDGAPPTVGRATRGALREIVLAGPGRSRVLVARSIRAEQQRLDSLLARVVLAGLTVLSLGLVGGWWLARRVLAPVGALARAAEAVSERDLSRRLDERAAPEELRGLARSFNATLERLEAAFRRQARFTADASHELRTPVAVIRAQAELALRGERKPQDYREALAACLRAAERMTGLVEGLLALGRTDAGECAPERESVALDAVVRETAELLRPTAEAARVSLECRTEPALVRGDARLLSEALANLISNGVRYNRPGGSVEVGLVREDGRAVVRVADSGLGIPAEALPHLFERFYRVDDARSRERGGSGLGLAITRSVVEAHGGSIEVSSRVGAGSTFTVRLPALAA